MKKRLIILICLFALIVLAGCQKENEYTVSFDLNGGIGPVSEQIVKQNQKATIPKSPIKEGYEFVGWYKDKGLNEEDRWAFSVDVVSADIVLYAKWEAIVDEFEIIKTSQTYLEDTADEFVVYKFETNIEGPTIFIIGGIHGDERAGWHAATEMLEYDFERGTTYILPVASKRACTSNPPVRYFQTDLNRSFPGKETGTETEILAYTIFSVIAQINPDLVLDLHESRGTYQQGYLGHSIIIHNGLYNLYVLDVLYEFNNLELMEGKLPYHLEANPPIGSLNKEVTERLNILVLTIETNRGSLGSGIQNETVPLDLRVLHQKTIINIILNSFEILN